MKGIGTLPVMVTACVCAASASADVVIEAVTVGNPGNPDHTQGYGGVDYVYRIGKYEVTAGQYTGFLNAVAATDTYGLYNTDMWSSRRGCKIERSGLPGSYTYSVAPDWANRPVNYISWGDAARFSNWLHNGQPIGAQGVGTTEDGSYFLDGAVSDTELLAITREPDATWVIPSEDEWYKAAYHKNDGVTRHYFIYPTSGGIQPGYVRNDGTLSGTGDPFVEGGMDPGNYATFDGDLKRDGIGRPYYRTKVGEWENSASPSGTYDQAGNVWEWNEAIIGGYGRGSRGGSFNFAGGAYGGSGLCATRRVGDPSEESVGVGLRVAQVLQPITAPLDIKPGSCPNPLNTKSRGVVPVAIVGTTEFDVTLIDPNSLVLTRADGVGSGVAPLMGPPGPGVRVEDVATPFEGEPCACHEMEGDGIDDLAMKFETQILVAELQLNEFPGGTFVELVLSGEFLDGTRFGATDCIRIVPCVSDFSTSEASPDGEHGGLDARSVSRPQNSENGRPTGNESAQDANACE